MKRFSLFCRISIIQCDNLSLDWKIICGLRQAIIISTRSGESDRILERNSNSVFARHLNEGFDAMSIFQHITSDVFGCLFHQVWPPELTRMLKFRKLVWAVPYYYLWATSVLGMHHPLANINNFSRNSLKKLDLLPVRRKKKLVIINLKFNHRYTEKGYKTEISLQWQVAISKLWTICWMQRRFGSGI